eukprot:762681-Hanusia_phi.AAC.2
MVFQPLRPVLGTCKDALQTLRMVCSTTLILSNLAEVKVDASPASAPDPFLLFCLSSILALWDEEKGRRADLTSSPLTPGFDRTTVSPNSHRPPFKFDYTPPPP